MYGVNSVGAFPLSQYVVSGNYTNQALTDPTVLDAVLFQQGVAGVSWPQVNQVLIFGEADNWIIANVTFPNAPSNLFTGPIVVQTTTTNNSSTTVSPSASPTSTTKNGSGIIGSGVLSVIVAVVSLML